MEESQSNSTSSSGSKKGLIIAAIAVIVIIAVAAGGFAFLNLNKENSSEEANESAAVENAENQAQTSQMPEESNTTSSGSTTTTSSYKDGTYTATGTYAYHSGTESIEVTVTLKNGEVVDVAVVNMAKAPTSKKIQDDFIANFKEMVVGKNIDEVKLGKVSGSSLTGIGFNAAIEDIKSQAQS